MAIDMFLVLKPKSGLPAFKAETADATFARYVSIPVVNFALGYAIPSVGARLTFQNLNLVLNSVANSPGFLTMANLSQTFDSVTLYVRNTTGTTGALHVTSIYHFGNVRIAAVTMDGNTGDNAPVVNLSLNFTQFAHHGSSTGATGVVTSGLVGTADLNTVQWSEPALDGPGWV